jgi:hypothetical protein
MNGVMLALHDVNCPHDVHHPGWEMHPEGDELLLPGGALSQWNFEREPLQPQAALIVPAGIAFTANLASPDCAPPAVPIAIIPLMGTWQTQGHSRKQCARRPLRAA